MSDSRPKIAYRNAQRAYNAYREATGAVQDTKELMAEGRATVDDFAVAKAVEARAWKHAVAAGKRYRDIRPRMQKDLDVSQEYTL